MKAMPAPRLPHSDPDPASTALLKARGRASADLTARDGTGSQAREWFSGHEERPETKRYHEQQAARQRLYTLCGGVVLAVLIIAVVVLSLL